MSAAHCQAACATAEPPAAGIITGPLTVLFAAAVGVIVTNLFAPQILVGPISLSLGLGEAGTGLVAMATPLGYAAGLLFLVPLADLRENRALIVRMLSCAGAAAAAAALAPTAVALLIFLFMLGAACSAIQIIVPIAAAMAPPERRGRVIGDVMSGLMIGILLSRPLASVIADAGSWRAFYGTSAIAVAMLAAVLAVRLPRRQPAAQSGYPALIASLWHLLRTEPVLRRRALTASLVMAAFSLFWTSVALRLSQPPFDLGPGAIALFALAGAGGAIATPLAGRAGDRGWMRLGTIVSHLISIGALALAGWAGSAGVGAPQLALILMGVSAVLLDAGVTVDLTLGRYAINLLRPEARGRINGLFVGLFFAGGAAGSAIAGIAWARGGWLTICGIGAALSACALAAGWLCNPGPGPAGEASSTRLR
jgi:predicted MFS family arabinose efflux permease